jgi:hypothetical protein
VSFEARKMDRMEDLLKGLKLSDVENKGLRIGGSDGTTMVLKDPQVIVKLLSDKPGHADAMEVALGRVWCPLRGAACKDMGENVFIFTLRQESGKNKALFDGPWSFNKSLLVVEDFVLSKTLEEYEFITIPIWIRLFGLPLGMMDQDTGEAIGDEVGVFMEADVGEDGMAKGKFLRIKVRINIKKPLMRGIMLNVEKGQDDLWCRFEYEFLPDFCYKCGFFDHIDRDCKVVVARGEKTQYGSWLKAFIPRQNVDHNQGAWARGSGSNRRFGFHNHSGRSHSDGDNWRKRNDAVLQINKNGEEPQLKNPLKEKIEIAKMLDTGNTMHVPIEAGQKQIQNQDKSSSVVSECVQNNNSGGPASTMLCLPAIPLATDVVAMHVDQPRSGETGGLEDKQERVQVEKKNDTKWKKGTFKRIHNERKPSSTVDVVVGVLDSNKKRCLEEEMGVMEGDKKKKAKASFGVDLETINLNAGLPGQSCESQ